MKTKSIIYCVAVALILVFAPASSRAEIRNHAGPLLTMDNASAGNHVLAYSRAANGAVSFLGEFATGGIGTDSGLGNQAALILSRGGRRLFACNAGSDEISVFRVTPHGLQLTDKVGSGGRRPISLALHGNLLYVLNAGGLVDDADNVTAFLFLNGHLSFLVGSTRFLSAANTDPAQISFLPDGNVLVVTEKATGIIDTFTVNDDGLIDEHQQFASVGQTPFGFAFRRDVLIVSGAFGGAPDASAVSSYEVADDGSLQVISPSVPTTETAACWIVVTRNGHFAYASNTGSGTLSGYDVSSGGSLNLLNADGLTAVTGPGPIDMALSVNSHFLYALNSGNGTISAFRVNHDGSLSSLPGLNGIPSGANGLAVR